PAPGALVPPPDARGPAGASPAPELVRGLGPLEATSLVVGGIIGASIYLVPSFVAQEVGAPGASLAVWALSGLLATCGALCFAELAAAIPETGGTYAFLKRAYGSPLVAFLFAWSMFFATSTAAIGAVGTSVAIYAGYFLEQVMPYGKWETRGVAVAVILTFALVNYVGVRTGGRTQNVLTGLKVALMVGVIAVPLLFADGDVGRVLPLVPADRPLRDVGGAMAASMVLTLFSFSGWHFATHVAGEIREPSRNIPRAIFIAMAVVLVLYLLVNLAYVYTLPFDQLRASKFVAADTMRAVVGPAGGGIVSLAVMMSAIGALNAQLLNYPRIIFALARDQLFFQPVSRVHPEYRTPATAILILGFWASVFAFAGTYQQILTYVGFVNHLFLSLAVAGVIVLRFREPALARPYRTWGYPVTPLLFLSVSAWYLGTLLVHRLELSLVGVGITALGVPFYLYWSARRARVSPGAV
ncbi:MAG: amino acid permease, partial [Gemmatimonadetes bacterium]|nr:amino acid permease [Gemmatimonadota bacterium]